VRLNNVVLRSYTPDWATEVDRIEFTPNPGGIMEPYTGQDVRINNILLKANGNQSAWSYRYGLSYSYTYWRPTLPASATELATNGYTGTYNQTEPFGEVSNTETNSFRFEGQGCGRRQQFNPQFENNTPNPQTGALTLPATFTPFGETNETEFNFNEGGEFVTNVGETGIVIEKIGGTVRIKI
jgi:hypothetical protein